MEGWDADRASAWHDHPTTVPEMKAFLGLVLLMGVVRCPRYHLHWSTMEMFYHPFFSAIMPRNRYSLLRRFLHLSDNTAPNPNNNRLHKLESFLSLLIPKFRSLYLPKKMISPDESMIKFKGRLGIVQYMPKKPIKWGIKAWALCESDSGYTWNWKVYTGREEALQAVNAGDHDGPNSHPPESSIYASGKVVLSLVEGLEGKGYWLFCDNFYTSPALFQKLNEIGFGCCGTARSVGKGTSTGANPKVHKMKKGDRPKYYKKKGQMCVVWMDKKPVTLLTTLDGPGEDVKRIRSRQGVDGHREISRPTAISTYNKHMGGVDKADQLIQYYLHQHRSLKWWKRIFFHLLETTLVNAHIIYKSYDHPKLDLLQFRVKVIKAFFGWPRAQHGRRGSREGPAIARLTPGAHFLKRVESRPDCVVCSNRYIRGGRKQTQFVCKSCDKAMCPTECFERFHTLVDYKLH
nr:piggyBac transposable element-derived protein 4-like [Lytechinus pictus]